MAVEDTSAAAAAAVAEPPHGSTWNTGLFQVTADLETFIFIAAFPCLAVENKMAVTHDTLPVATPGFFSNVGCVHGDSERCVNLCLFGCCAPCIYPFWRGAVRQKYGIQGSLPADCCASCCCMPLAIMQDARMVKAHHH